MNKMMQILMLIGITSAAAPAEEALQRSQILQILEHLCQNPRNGWIQQGQIKAFHHCTDEITDETTDSTETITTDGNHFSWQISVDSYDKNGKQNPGEYMRLNRDRLFVWDGETYTMYFNPGNQAIVYEDISSVPVNVTGPLKAGYIPWGRGTFSYEALSATQVSAARILTEDGERIVMSILFPNRPQIQVLLDPANNYAVLSYTIDNKSSKTIHLYSNYVFQTDRHIPMNILIEHWQDEQLRSSDSWEILSVQDYFPEKNQFRTPFRDAALVEYHTPMLDKSIFFRHSKHRQIKPLLEKRLQTALAKNIQKQNCATVAIGQMLEPFGIEVSDSELSSLVGDSQTTSLYQIQQFIQRKILFCRPIKTTVQSLRPLKDCQILLHFPQQKHFAVLDRIEAGKVWIIDLDQPTFYRYMELSRFEQEWAGIALLVSDQPISLPDNAKPIPDDVLKQILGGANYSCSKLIQDYDVALCPKMMLNICAGIYQMWYQRYGCQEDAEGDFCEGTGMIGSVYSYCIEDASNPGQCDITGDFKARYIRACQP